MTRMRAPEIAAPFGSVTVPVSVARSTWARAGIADKVTAASSSKRFMGSSVSVGSVGMVAGESYTRGAAV